MENTCHANLEQSGLSDREAKATYPLLHSRICSAGQKLCYLKYQISSEKVIKD